MSAMPPEMMKSATGAVQPVRKDSAMSTSSSPPAEAPHGYVYCLVDWDPTCGIIEEDWARELSAEGWRMWVGAGPWVTINNRRLRRWSLRRPRPAPDRDR